MGVGKISQSVKWLDFRFSKLTEDFSRYFFTVGSINAVIHLTIEAEKKRLVKKYLDLGEKGTDLFFEENKAFYSTILGAYYFETFCQKLLSHILKKVIYFEDLNVNEWHYLELFKGNMAKFMKLVKKGKVEIYLCNVKQQFLCPYEPLTELIDRTKSIEDFVLENAYKGFFPTSVIEKFIKLDMVKVKSTKLPLKAYPVKVETGLNVALRKYYYKKAHDSFPVSEFLSSIFIPFFDIKEVWVSLVTELYNFVESNYLAITKKGGKFNPTTDEKQIMSMENPFPAIFPDYNSFKIFSLLVRSIVREKYLTEDIGFIFFKIQEDGLIKNEVNEKSFRTWLNKEYDFRLIEELKQLPAPLTRKKALKYNQIKKVYEFPHFKYGINAV